MKTVMEKQSSKPATQRNVRLSNGTMKRVFKNFLVPIQVALIPQNKNARVVTLHSLVRRIPMALNPLLGGLFSRCSGPHGLVFSRMYLEGAFAPYPSSTSLI